MTRCMVPVVVVSPGVPLAVLRVDTSGKLPPAPARGTVARSACADVAAAVRLPRR
jgi:hypothetical protein